MVSGNCVLAAPRWLATSPDFLSLTANRIFLQTALPSILWETQQDHGLTVHKSLQCSLENPILRGICAMPLSGEAIRLMNYLDDVSVTLRRVLATIPALTPEERERVAAHLEGSKPSVNEVIEALHAK